MDDIFFNTVFFNRGEYIDFILRKILPHIGIKDHKLKDVKTQYVIPSIESREIRIDALVETTEGHIIPIEIQKSHPERMNPKRIRYIEGTIDHRLVGKGQEGNDLLDRIFIVISQKNLLGLDQAFSIIERRERRSDLAYNDGSVLILVNPCETDHKYVDIHRLVTEMSCNKIEDITDPTIIEIFKEFKFKEKGEKMLLDEYHEMMRTQDFLYEKLQIIAEQQNILIEELNKTSQNIDFQNKKLDEVSLENEVLLKKLNEISQENEILNRKLNEASQQNGV